MSVDELKDRLRAGAEKVDQGRIRVDAQRALAKLRDHRLADPHAYALELLRAAAASGATRVDVRVDADDFELHFDGKPFPQPVLRGLLGQALTGGDGEEDRARLLALGVAGALGLKPRWVKVESGDVTLEVRPPDKVQVALRSGGTSRARTGTFVHVRGRVGWRVVRNLFAGPAERALIAASAPAFPAVLTLNGKRVGGDDPLGPGLLARTEVTAGTSRLLVGVPAEPAAHSTLALDVHGVTVVTRRVELPFLQVVAWARDADFRRNASGSDVVDGDARSRRVMGKLHAVAVGLLRELVERLRKEKTPEVRRFLTELVLAKAPRRLAELPAEVRGQVETAPLIPGPAGEWASVADFAAEVKAGRRLKFARRKYPSGSYTGPVVLLDGVGRALQHLLPRRLKMDVAVEVEARRQAAENRAAWEREPAEEARLPAGDYLARAAITGEQVLGEVGLAAQTAESTVRVLCMGKLVWQSSSPAGLEPLRVHAVLDLRRPLPERVWARPSMAVELYQVEDAVRQATAEAIDAALAGAAPPPEALREHARDLLVHLLKRSKPPRLADLPRALREAPLFELAGGALASLEALTRKPPLRYLVQRWPFDSLNGHPVAVLRAEEVPLLEAAIGKGKLRNDTRQLEHEKDIRARLQGRREEARVPGHKVATVALDQEGITGEVALLEGRASQLWLRLLKDGFLLEETFLTARYEVAAAAVDCRELAPNEEWNGARRDRTFERVLAVVHEGERRLAAKLVERIAGRATLDELAPGPQRFLTAFLRKELGAVRSVEQLDEVQRAVYQAPLFGGAHGPLSLAQLAAAAAATGKLWVQHPPSPEEVPEGMTVVRGDAELARLLSTLLGKGAEEPAQAIAAARLRAAFLARPQAELSLPRSARPAVTVSTARARGLVGYDPSLRPCVDVELRHQRRPLRSLLVRSVLPLRAALEVIDLEVDPALPALPRAVVEAAEEAIALGERRLVEAALEEPAAWPELLLRALGGRLDEGLPPEQADRLRRLALFPCIDGHAISTEELDRLPRVCLVTEDLSGVPTSGEPVVLAHDPLTWAALERRYERRADLTTPLKAKLAARRRLEQVPAVGRVEVSGEVVRRGRLERAELEGEVALVPPGAGGRIALFHDRRPLATIAEPRLPATVAAAVSSRALLPDPAGGGVARDAEYERALEACVAGAEALAREVAQGWRGEPEPERLAAALVPVVGWLARRKKHPAQLLSLPLLRTTDGRRVSFRQVQDEQKHSRRVSWADMEGSLEGGGLVLWPRAGEREVLARLKVNLWDATDALRAAAAVKARPKEASLSAGLASPWREPVSGDGIAGEVALDPRAPRRRLTLELLRERVLVEQVELQHPIGGVARINCDALKPVKSWTQVARNAAYRTVREAIEGALERLLARLLRTGEAEPCWRAYAVEAVRWKVGGEGPVAAALPGLPLFRSMDRSPVTLGQVLEEVSKRGRVAVAEPSFDTPPFEGLLLAGVSADVSLLTELKLQYEDVTASVRRARILEASRRARRLSSLRYDGEALVRLAVDADGLRGELALPLEPAEGTRLVLARECVAVDRFDDDGLGVAGVLDHSELPVDADWSRARLTPALRRQVLDHVDALFAELAAMAAAHPLRAGRRAAAMYALRYLHRAGVTAPEHLERVVEPAAGLTAAKLFLTCDDRLVDLRAIAGRVVRRGAVPVLGWRPAESELGGEVALGTDNPLAELGQVLGEKRLWRPRDKAEWQRERAEEEPEQGTPLATGIVRLRREARLLKSAAFGRLSPEELAEIRLRRAGGREPIAYEPERRLALLDPDHPQVRAALEEWRLHPERLYVLLTAIYAAVNRALERVTDEDEARMVAALMSHLASNPSLLEA